MFLVSSCSCLCPFHWSQVLTREWRCSRSSADRRSSNYIWEIINFIAYEGATYIRYLMAYDVFSGFPHCTRSARTHSMICFDDYEDKWTRRKHSNWYKSGDVGQICLQTTVIAIVFKKYLSWEWYLSWLWITQKNRKNRKINILKQTFQKKCLFLK